MKYEIWLNDTYGWFDRGVAYLYDGRELELASMIHYATYGKDSLLIDDVEQFDLCRFPLRWFISPKGVSFYSVDNDSPGSVLFHNKSHAELQIDTFGTLPHGESLEIELN